MSAECYSGENVMTNGGAFGCCRACSVSRARGRGIPPHLRRRTAAAARRPSWLTGVPVDLDETVPAKKSISKVRQNTPRDADLVGRCSAAGQDQRSRSPASSERGVDGQRAHLAEVLPEHVQRAAADDVAVALGATKNSCTSSYSVTVAFDSSRRSSACRSTSRRIARDVGRPGPAHVDARPARSLSSPA